MNTPAVRARIGTMAIGLLAFWSVAEAKVAYVAKTGSDANDGLSWATAKGTVQAGLNTAVAGDEVWVAAGTYVECIGLTAEVALYGGFTGSETELVQRNWKVNATVLDGDRAGSVVTAPSGATATTRIDGFTIRNGTGTLTGSSRSGGGIYCSYVASPTISNNTITGNSAGSLGGGIVCVGGSPMISNNTITGNSAAGSITYGGGIYCSHGSPMISNNTITGNTASSGGGLYCESSLPTITNTVIAFNTSGISWLSSDTPSLRYNCVFGNIAYNYSGMTDPTGTNGNISVDPRLLAADYGEVHLKAGSPCINTGDDTAAPPSSVDMDGEPRVQGTQVDIGADEFNGTQPSFTPRIVRVSLSGNDDNDGSSWELAKRTVQAGINATKSGGEVWVAAGTYNERITLTLFFQLYGGFAGTETCRDQRDWVNHVTILDGNADGSVVSVSFGSVMSVVDGFTIRNGTGTLSDSFRYGGGIYCSTSSPAITNNTITGNNTGGSVAYGGGIYCSSSSPIIANNTITDNGGTGIDAYGGGVYCSGGSPTISSNTIIGNSASSGGGIYCRSSSQTITDNIIRGNKASAGGGMYFNESSPTISNNAVSENTASSSGGGIYCVRSSATVKNNTITGNYGYGGGGIYSSASSLLIANNTITGNAAQSGGGYYGRSTPATIVNTIIAFNSSGLIDEGSTLSLRSNCIHGNTDYNYSGLTDPTGTNGNISVDPGLAGPFHGNIHIQPDSPCVDVGDDTVADSGSTDMDGQARIAGTHIDIGVDESNGTVWPVGPSVIVRVSPEGSDANDGASWASAKRTVQAAIDAAAPAGGDVWVRAGVYPERITLPPHVHLYGGFDGAETQIGQRNWRIHASILDGQAGGSVVMVDRPGYLLCTIDGFTIRNGNATEGGGINCRYSSPMITHNAITGNNAVLGGGIICKSSGLIIAENAIAGNMSSQGAGLWCVANASRIVNNTIRRNIATEFGGGICISGVSMILNNTITENAAVSGGGIYMGSTSSKMVIANTIVAFNSSGLCLNRGSSPSMRANCVFGNTAYDYNAMTDPTGTNGNIVADPSFVHRPAPGADGQWATADDDQGDLHLKAGSPCIDAGDNGAVPAGILSRMDSLLRFFDDPATADTGLGTAPIIDMGAYEYAPGDFDRDGDVDADDLKAFAACISGPTIPYSGDCAGADFDKDGDVDQSDFGFIQRCLSGAGKAVDPACGD